MRNILFFSMPLLLTCFLITSAMCFAQVTEKWVKRQNGNPHAVDIPNGLVADHRGNVYVTGRSDGKGTNADYTTIRYNDDGDKKWVKRYNGPGNDEDEAVAIAMDGDGNVYVTGWSTGNGTGRDYATIKYDDDGDKKWAKRYNGPGNEMDVATAIAVDKNGNVYVTGWSVGNETGRDYTTIKYDNDGDTKWIKRYNGPGNKDDQATAIALDNNGNVYVTGSSTGNGTANDYTTIKYDKDGHTEWVQRYDGPVNDNDRANALAVDAQGNVYVTGFISIKLDEDGNPSDIATIKYNTLGVQQWAAIYNSRSFDAATAIAVDSSGNVFITGVGGAPDETYFSEFATIKYNSAGVQQWAEKVEPPAGGLVAKANDLALDKAGNVYITGGIEIMYVINYITIRYDTNGVQQWTSLHDGEAPANEFVSAISLDENGNVYITGSSRYKSDYVTVKYNANGAQKWIKKYDGTGGGDVDMATAVAVDKDGNVLVAGSVTKINTGLDFTTYKYDRNGDRIWKKTFSGQGNGADQASAMAFDAKGNVYVTGTTFSSGTGDNFATIKYDKYGITKWVKKYNGPANSTDEATAIAVDENGYVYVTGVSVSNGTNRDYATIKYDGNGNTIWIKTYNGPGNLSDQPTAIAVDKSGNVYVTGQSIGTGTFYDYATIKYGANGNELWVARYSTNGNDDALAMAVDTSGNVYITGSGAGNYATVKYSSMGVQQWVAIYNGPLSLYGNEARDIAVNAFGDVYVTGISGDDFATIKYNTMGIQQWVASYNGSANSFDMANALALDTLGNVYVTGESGGDYTTLKYNSAGVQQWVASYNGPGNSSDIATAVALDGNGNVYVTGRSQGNGTDYDYATIKYEQSPLLTRSLINPEQNTGIEEKVSIKLQVKALPNAFTEFTNLQWSGSDKPVTITISDAMGRLVEKRAGLAASGSIQTGYRFGPGIYFAEIAQGTEKVVVKLVKN